MREDVAWQRDLARLRDEELQALRARESKTAVEIKGLRALATRLGEQMSSEASLREQLDYSRRLFGLQCEELFDLRARVAELEGLRAAGEKSLDEKLSSESSEPRETRKRDAETLTTTRGIHNANKRVWLGKTPITCCAAQCEDEIKHKGELVSLPWCRHMMHVDCIMMMRAPQCPQCRKSVCASAEAHFKLLNDNEIIQRENQRVEDELEARRIARAPPL